MAASSRETKSGKKGSDEEVYEEGENVLSFHGPMLYDAKVLKVNPKNNTYFLHYNGWGKRWDEWVKTDRIMKDNDENRTHAKELKKKVAEDKKANKGGTKRKGAEPASSTKGARGKKKAKGGDDEDDDTVEGSEERMAREELKIKMPGKLKKALITDWEAITKNEQLVPLPRDHTVTSILNDFKASAKNHKDDDTAQILEEVITGIKKYFDAALGPILLYRFERPQHKKLAESKRAPSDIYSAEHLLRLFVKLPELLAHSRLTEKEAVVLQAKLQEFLKWLEKKNEYFATDYHVPPEDYKKEVEA